MQTEQGGDDARARPCGQRQGRRCQGFMTQSKLSLQLCQTRLQNVNTEINGEALQVLDNLLREDIDEETTQTSTSTTIPTLMTATTTDAVMMTPTPRLFVI